MKLSTIILASICLVNSIAAMEKGGRTQPSPKGAFKASLKFRIPNSPQIHTAESADEKAPLTVDGPRSSTGSIQIHDDDDCSEKAKSWFCMCCCCPFLFMRSCCASQE